MSHIDEQTINAFMKLTGLSHDEAEIFLTQKAKEVMARNAPAKKTTRKSKAKYDEDNYPHFIPSDDIKKYTVRVALKDAPVPVWRKFECPSNISLRHLTELLIELMGWSNAHLNQIYVGQKTFYVPFYQHDDDLACGDIRFQEDYRLSDLLSAKGKTLRWEYDFGDSWMHDIRLSSVAEYEDDESHDIIFKSGKGACPPEDCRGVWGYQELLELHEKRKSRKRLTSEEKERLEWYGIYKEYDPEYLDEFECIDICDSFSFDDDDDIVDASNGIRLLEHNLQGGSLLDEKHDPGACGSPAEIETSPLYDECMSLAFRIRELEPWEDLDDSDVYAIRMQDGSEIYVTTMGNGGESFDVQFFDGQESFQIYLNMVTANVGPDFELLENQNWADYKSIMFQDPEDGVMTPRQYSFIEQWAKAHDVQINPAHGYPFLQHFRPHRCPSMMTSGEHDLPRLKEALEAVVWFCQLLLDTDDLTSLGFKDYCEYATAKGGKEVPLIVKTADGYKVERTKLPGLMTNYERITLPEKDLQPLRFLQKNGTQFIRLMHIPGFVGSEDDQENAYTILIYLLLDKKTEQLSMSEPCELTDTFELDSLRQYAKKLQSWGTLPQRLITDDPRTEAYLNDFCQQLGIILEFKRTRIPQLTMACQTIYDMRFE